jgi:sulfide:quinone oxidoreductase
MASDAAGAQGKTRVLIAGGGVAAVECALALADLAPTRTEVKLLAPEPDFVYRPLAVQEPFAYGPHRTYPLEPIVRDIGGELIADRLAWVDPDAQLVHTAAGAQIGYDALVLAVGAIARPRYEHALTVDDRHLDETLHGLVQDIEGGYVRELAFVVPARMGWPFPIYELALMSAGRAYDMGAQLAITIVTPEDRPLAIFGDPASEAVAERLAHANITTITSAYAEIPAAGRIEIGPGGQVLTAQRIVALPELYGPPIRGIPSAEHGFLRTDQHGQLHDVGPIYAAGDATDFPVKHGGLASQEADAVAESIAALAGADITPEPFRPVIRGMLLTDSKPLFMSARITGGQGFSSQVSETPFEGRPAKIAAKYLGPYLEARDAQPA